MTKDTTIPNEEELRKEIKMSGWYLNWAEHTNVPKSEHDKWIDIVIHIVDRHHATALHEAEVRAQQKITGETSDGYHTFNELYEFRMLYNAALFNEWAQQHKYRVYKSRVHEDGLPCFGGGWFVVAAELPTGQISNHYEDKYWDLFKVSHLKPQYLPKFDGHTPQDVATRLLATLGTERKKDDRETLPGMSQTG